MPYASYQDEVGVLNVGNLTVIDGAKTVAAAGTAVALTATSTYAQTLQLIAKKVTGSNTGNIYVGISTVDKTTRQIVVLEPDDYLDFPIPGGSQVNLTDIYIDADTNDDGVVWIGMR